MRAYSGSIAVMMAMGMAAGACGSSSSSGPGHEGIDIVREDVPEGRFKPSELEDAIDAMVEAIEESGVSNDMAMGVVLKELTGFWRPVSKGANRAINELGVIGSVKGTTEESLDVPEQVAEQIEFVEEQTEDKVDGLAIAPHNQDLTEVLEEFSAETKAPMVTIDSDLDGIDRSIYIGTDNIQAGRTGGESLLEVLDDDEGVVIVLGNTDPAWAGGYDRTFEAADVLEDAGNQVIVLNSIWDPEQEVPQILEAIEEADGPVVGMLGVFANAFNLAAAAEELDLDPMPAIVAFDFEPDTLSYMQDGIIARTHVQRQYYMGYMAVYTVFAIHALGEDRTKELLEDLLIDGFHLDTGLDVIRAEDLDEYNDFIDDLGI